MATYIRRYLQQVLRGSLVVVLFLVGLLSRTPHGWTLAWTPWTFWVVISWLGCYPVLRTWHPELYSRKDPDMTSFKARALALHHQDLANAHQGHRWTLNGVSSNPWEYSQGRTQSTDDIVNPLYRFCAHLWMSVLLILLGPVLVGGEVGVRGLRAGYRWLRHR